mmetsp:Transcript_19463/g.58813  ORF Transcript_19463/g.58813 Transcript_19463/m.58813 type:complete len:186 (-) Transcript_19463:432-989(-)
MMGFFSTFRDFVLGVDPTTGAAAESSGAHHPQQQARHAPGSTASKRTRTDDRDARAQSDAVSGKAVGGELPKGPGVLEELQAGTSGGIQGLDWYRRRLREDADGDVAEAFYRESPPQSAPVGSAARGGPGAASIGASATAPAAGPQPLEEQRSRLRRLRHGGIAVKGGDVHYVDVAGSSTATTKR